MHRRIFIAAALLGFAALSGCGPHWRVVTQASPDTFVGQRHFALMPIDYVGLFILDQREDQYLASKDADEHQRFVADKESINEEFTKALVARAQEEGIEITPTDSPTSASFVLKPYVGYMNPGFYAVVSSAPSQIRMTLRITTPDGRVLDEVQFSSRTASPIPNTNLSPAEADMLKSGGRWREDARVIGAYAARYLASRVNP
ncbi:hypothetical protein WME90_02845 [Sorangium sp. So ce375]|uniref:hypothetical protein n=1 Tax=Sorangium sp. So ce375 TaxID=3133306 RepID=UPI003F5C5B11